MTTFDEYLRKVMLEGYNDAVDRVVDEAWGDGPGNFQGIVTMKCPCSSPSEWCQTLVDTGYLPCTNCGEHHRHPETCKEDGV